MAESKPARKKPGPKKGTPAPKGVKVHHRHKSGAGIIRVAPRQADVLEDPESVKDWDDEELERGYRRSKTGNFTGRPPGVVPRFVLEEQKRRRLIQGEEELSKGIKVAIDTLMTICAYSEDDKAKVAAAKLILERGMGATPKTFEHHIAEEPKWAKALQGGIVAIGPAKDDADDDIEDAVLVEEEVS